MLPKNKEKCPFLSTASVWLDSNRFFLMLKYGSQYLPRGLPRLVQWYRIHLSMKEMQGTWVRSLGRTPWSRQWQLTLVFLPGKFHVQRSLAGYGSWGHKESGMTEWAYTAQLYPSLKNRYFQLQIKHTTARALALTNILSASLRTNIGLVTVKYPSYFRQCSMAWI